MKENNIIKWEKIEKIEENKKIVIFGASSHSNYLLNQIKNKKMIIAVVDNDKRKWGLKFSDIFGELLENSNLIINSPESLINIREKQNIIIAIASVHEKEIVEQVRKLGFSNFLSIISLENDEKDKKDQRKNVAVKYKSNPIVNNKVLFIMGFDGSHEKYITLELEKYTQLDLVWCVRSPREDKPKSVRMVCESNWKQYYQEIETAKVIIYDSRLPIGYIKKRGQYVIHTKHWSSITLKKFYLEDKTAMSIPGLAERQKEETSVIDFIFNGSEFDEKTCRTGFGYDGKFIRVGSPRSDVLFKNESKQKICDYYGIDYKIHLLMYAPTFRSNIQNNKEYIAYNPQFYFNVDEIVNVLKKRFGGEWKCLKRLHPMAAIQASDGNINNNVIDVSLYQDAQELVAASEVMITDYSSIMFESAYKFNPVFLFAPDRIKYIKEERDLLIDYESLPFDISESNDELIKCISDFNEDLYKKKVKKFLDSYGVHEDGHASERAAQFILKLIEQKELNYE